MLDKYGKRLNLRGILRVALLSSTLGVMYDLFTDPVAVALKVWVWSYDGPWYGVPTSNFIGWLIMISSTVIGYHTTLSYGKTNYQKILMAILSILMANVAVISIMRICSILNIR